MTKRVLLAGLVAGVGMYAWTSIAHTMTPLGEAGIQELPNEAVVLTTLHSTLGPAPGFYLFPGMGVGKDATADQKKAAAAQYGQRLATNPAGVLMYNPPGSMAISARLFITEFVIELLEAMLAIILLSQTNLRTWGSRVAFVTAIGFIACITTNASYWNWYGFPTTYTASYMFMQLVAFFVAGAIGASILRTGAPRAAQMAA